MTTDRLVRARAEAERRYPGGQRRFTEANLQAAFRQGWLAADANHPAVEALARVRGLHRKTSQHCGCRQSPAAGDPVPPGTGRTKKEPHDIYLVRPACEGVFVGRADAENARVLHRAPKREAWQDLGDKLAVEMPGIEDEPRIEALAKALYCEHGVRVVGDDDRG